MWPALLTCLGVSFFACGIEVVRLSTQAKRLAATDVRISMFRNGLSRVWTPEFTGRDWALFAMLMNLQFAALGSPVQISSHHRFRSWDGVGKPG